MADAPSPTEPVAIAGVGLCPWETTVLLGRSPLKQVVAGAEWLLEQDRAVTREDLARLGVEVAECVHSGGGSGANAACAASRAGAAAAHAGVVGDDEAGEKVVRDLALHGVGTESLVTLAGKRTREFVLVSWPGRPAPRLIAHARKPPAEETDALPRPRCGLLHLNTPSARNLRWAREQRAEGGAVSVDLGPGWARSAGARERAAELLRRAQVILLSGSVARGIAEALGVDRHGGHGRLALGLRARLPECEILVITLGRDGAVAAEGDRALFAWPLDVEELDATGAGDCFAGHLLAAHAREGGLSGEGFEGALREATAAAGLSVTALSARGLLPSRGAARARAGEVQLATVGRLVPAEPPEGEFA